MKKVKIVKPAELTYQKTIHTLDVEVDGVVYTAYRVEDCKGADTEFADPDNVPLEVQQAIDALFWDDEYACSDIVGGEVFEVNMDDYL
jgi:hypothetical protein